MSDQKYVLAIDQGTTSSRAIIFDHSGRIVSVGGCRLALGRPVLRQLVGEEVAS